MANITYKIFDKTLFNEGDQTILQTSLANDIPHAHACGGNAVCSSCRVRVQEGLENLEDRNEKEKILADKMGFTDDLRLGCQSKIKGGNITIQLPVIDELDIQLVSNRVKNEGVNSVGEQKDLTFLFADMEGFTSFTESSQPYDVVHILNRYYHIVGKHIKEHNGFIVDYFGDGFLAVFGVDKQEDHAIDAIKSGLEIGHAMEKFNEYVMTLLNKEFKLRIGIHSDKVILGTIGMAGMQKLSVIGDGVNFASRIESANKELGTYFLISENTFKRTENKITIKKEHVIEVKGKTGKHKVFEVNELVEDTGADTVGLEQKVKDYLMNEIPVSLIPELLRIAFHDAADYNMMTKEGGMNASILHPDELKREDNNFVTQDSLDFINTTKLEFPSVSFSDILALIGATGVSKLNGPEIEVGIGRIDYSVLPEDPDCPKRTDSAAKLIRHFANMGLTNRDLVALSGAHTLGKADGRPFTHDLNNFSNSYFVILTSDQDPFYNNLLESDLQLLKVPKLLSIVQEYAGDEKLFFNDFAVAYRKMTWLGQNENESYNV